MRNISNRLTRTTDRRRNLGGAKVKRRARTVVARGDLRERLQFFETSTRLSDGESKKELDFQFEARGAVEEVPPSTRTFRHINVGDVDITHKFTIASRSALRDRMLIRWRDDLYSVVKRQDIEAQAVKWTILACRRTGDVLLEAAKA